MYYIFKKKTENTFLFRVYGRIFIELKYNESDELEFKIKPKPLDIKFKQKFREYLKKDKKLDIFEYNNIKLKNNIIYKLGIMDWGLDVLG